MITLLAPETQRETVLRDSPILSRRSAIYASLNWKHPDVPEFLTVKNWDTMEIVKGLTIAEAKKHDFNYPAPLDMTNISLNYDNKFLDEIICWEKEAGHIYETIKDEETLPLEETLPKTFVDNCSQALRTGEPGFSFNFGDKEDETGRNACCEVTSSDSNDV